MKEIINYADFEKIDIRVGTIIDVEENNKLKKPSFILKIDFGENVGIKKSSAQLRKNYLKSDLLNKQIAAVINFKPKQKNGSEKTAKKSLAVGNSKSESIGFSIIFLP